jgi:hypothetical protein
MALVNLQFQIDDAQLIPGPQGPQGLQGPQGEQGEQGQAGPQGYSAYDLAVLDGFNGTVTEWLESLVGAPGTGGSGDILDIMDFGGSLTGDNTAAFNLALAACVANNKTKIGFHKGFYRFNSAPDAIDGVTLVGQGKTASYLVRDYSGNFLNFGGGFLGGGGAKDMGILAGAGTSGGYAIHAYGQDGVGAADWATFDGLYVSSYGGTFGFGFVLDGNLRTTPQGVRSVRLLNSDFFAGTSGAMNIYNGVAFFADNVGTYPAGGTNGDVYIGGGSALTQKSNILCLDNFNIQGTLNISNSLKGTFSGHVINFIGASSASQWFVNGTKSGSVSNGLTSSHVNLA